MWIAVEIKILNRHWHSQRNTIEYMGSGPNSDQFIEVKSPKQSKIKIFVLEGIFNYNREPWGAGLVYSVIVGFSVEGIQAKPVQLNMSLGP